MTAQRVWLNDQLFTGKGRSALPPSAVFLERLAGWQGGPIRKLILSALNDADLAEASTGMKSRRFDPAWVIAAQVGMCMEDMAKLLETVNDEVLKAKRTLQDVANDVRATFGPLGDTIMKEILDLREKRMTAVREVREMVSNLRTLQEFFLDKNYDVEMQRLERLVALCKELQALKESGVFDAVCDSALRLAVTRDQTANG